MALWNKKRTHQVPTTLVQSAGTVTATFPDATYTCNVASGLTAFSMHYLYLRKISGVITLVFSTQIPSVFRATYADALLVGAFTANESSAFASFVQIEAPPVIKVNIRQGAGVVLNVSVLGFVSFSTRNDPYGCIRSEAGAYNSATGNFATTNPRIINPIPKADLSVVGSMGWSPGPNVANTWVAAVNLNGVQIGDGGSNGTGANSNNLQWLRSPLSAAAQNLAAGDYIEIKASNDSGSIGTYLKFASLEFNGTVALKDL